MLSAKVDTMILKNEVAVTRPQPPKIASSLSYENIVQNSSLMRHFVGLTSSQFEVHYNFLDHVSPLNTINYWNCKDSPAMEKGNTGRNCHFTKREQLFMCLVRLRRGFSLRTLSALLSTPDRGVEQTQLRKIFATYI